MTDRRFAVLVVAVFATVLLAVGVAAQQRAPREFRVGMERAAYDPSRIEARVGDTIRFVNDDGEDHVVFVPTYGHGIDFGTLKPGQEVVLALGRAGRFRVECVPHPAMLLDVVVAR